MSRQNVSQHEHRFNTEADKRTASHNNRGACATMSINQLLFKHLVFLPVTALRGENVRHYGSLLDESQWGTTADIYRVQEEKLRSLLSHAHANVAHFKQPLGQLDDLAAVTPSNLSALPFLTKSDLRDFQPALLSSARPKRLTKKTTGGSTGQAVTIWKSRTATAQETAAQYRGFRWAGVEIGDKQGRFWGVPMARSRDRLKAKLADFITNRMRCSAFAFSTDDMADYTAAMNRYKPAYLYGYVSMLCRYAEFLEDSRRRLDCDLKAIITTAEQLTNSHRSLLERVFDAPVFNEYGCGEIGTIAHQCERNAMHINSENMIVEILDGDRRCDEHEIGEIVVTELNNYAMPLIRYRLGDFASMSSAPCACGRSLPTLSEIAGRAYDLVYNREGEVFHGEFFMYIFEEIKRLDMGVGAFQVVQDTLDHFTIYLTPTETYSEATELLIRQRIREGYGSYADVDVVPQDTINREPSGKMRLIIGLGNDALRQ